MPLCPLEGQSGSHHLVLLEWHLPGCCSPSLIRVPSARSLFQLVFSVGQIKQYPVLSAVLYLLSWKSILPSLSENRLFPCEMPHAFLPQTLTLTCLWFDQVVCYITTCGLYSWAWKGKTPPTPPKLQLMYLFFTSSSFSPPCPPPPRKKLQVINHCIY